MAEGGFAPNVGAAVLPQNNKPLAYYLQHQEKQDILQQQRQKELQAIKQERNRALDEVRKVSPGDHWNAHSEMVWNGWQRDVINYGIDHINKGGDFYDPEFQKEWSDRQKRYNIMAKKSVAAKEYYDEVIDRIEDDDDILPEAKDAVKELIFDPDNPMQARNPAEIDMDAMEAVINNPEFYDKSSIFKNFMKDVPEQSRKYYTMQNDKLGNSYFDVESIVGKLIVEDPRTGRVLEDEAGTPLYRVTDEVLAMAHQNEKIKRILNQFPENQQRDILMKELSPYAYVERENTPTGRRGPGDGGGEKAKNYQEALNNRLDKVTTLMNPFIDENGEDLQYPTEEAQRLLGGIVGADFKGGEIVDAEFVRGASFPIPGGRSEPNNKIVFNIKRSNLYGEVLTEPESIDLSDPDALLMLHRIYNTSQSENFKIKEDDFLKRFRDRQKRDYANLGENTTSNDNAGELDDL